MSAESRQDSQEVIKLPVLHLPRLCRRTQELEMGLVGFEKQCFLHGLTP